MSARLLCALAALSSVAVGGCAGQQLAVGPGKAFSRIEDALLRARPGDTVLVHPLADGAPYEAVALKVKTSRLTFRAVPGPNGERVHLSGKGFEYSGKGKVPRAVFQFDPGADGCTLDGFEISDAHNENGIAAGIRINSANDITIRNCVIRDCDNGIKSSGDRTLKTARNQRIEGCLIYGNGVEHGPGSHNLYLGGTSVILSGCEIRASRTGHNVKSRAHYTRVEYSLVHDSTNREFDLVDREGETERPDSHAVLIGNIIVKRTDPEKTGNKQVIHFGQDGGHNHSGTLYLVNNTIVTPHSEAIIVLSAPGARAWLVNNMFWDRGAGEAARQVLLARNGALPENVSGVNNWFAGTFVPPPGTGLASGMGATLNWFGKKGEQPPFAAPEAGDFRLVWPVRPFVNGGFAVKEMEIPLAPGEAPPRRKAILREYKAPLATTPRPDDGKPDLGAFEYREPARAK